MNAFVYFANQNENTQMIRRFVLILDVFVNAKALKSR